MRLCSELPHFLLIVLMCTHNELRRFLCVPTMSSLPQLPFELIVKLIAANIDILNAVPPMGANCATLEARRS